MVSLESKLEPKLESRLKCLGKEVRLGLDEEELLNGEDVGCRM